MRGSSSGNDAVGGELVGIFSHVQLPFRADVLATPLHAEPSWQTADGAPDRGRRVRGGHGAIQDQWPLEAAHLPAMSWRHRERVYRGVIASIPP